MKAVVSTGRHNFSLSSAQLTDWQPAPRPPPSVQVAFWERSRHVRSFSWWSRDSLHLSRSLRWPKRVLIRGPLNPRVVVSKAISVNAPRFSIWHSLSIPIPILLPYYLVLIHVRPRGHRRCNISFHPCPDARRLRFTGQDDKQLRRRCQDWGEPGCTRGSEQRQASSP